MAKRKSKTEVEITEEVNDSPQEVIEDIVEEIKVEPEVAPKKEDSQPKVDLIPVKLLTLEPNENGDYLVRYVGSGSEKIIYKVSAEIYPYSYVTQYIDPKDLDQIL